MKDDKLLKYLYSFTF